ncbi:MAG: hypothetical protein H7274_24655 [Rhodoferax sp.]|nr:hypothetical protein [Rhodoferax sp.]
MRAWHFSTLTRWLVFVATSALTGCVVNDVKPFPSSASEVRRDYAIVVVGVTVSGPWTHQQFAVVLDQYDVNRQLITGSCFSYNRLDAVVPATQASTRFFAFEVPSGHYIYSAFNGATFAENDQAFQALPGHAVYVGNFLLGDNGSVTLKRDLAEKRSAIAQALPHAPATLEIAPAVTVLPARPFMCTP